MPVIVVTRLRLRDPAFFEATFVDWEQSSPALPDWQTGYVRLIADGEVSGLTHASDANETRAFPAPVENP